MAAALLGDEQSGNLALHPRRDQHRARFGQRLHPDPAEPTVDVQVQSPRLLSAAVFEKG
jgi:hypothetical protein